MFIFYPFQGAWMSELTSDCYLAYATLVYRNFLKDLSSREPPGTLPRGVGPYNPKADAKLGLLSELANYSGRKIQ